MKPHKHAKLIKAWADGAEIECRGVDGSWNHCGSSPNWFDTVDYRVKDPVILYRVGLFWYSANKKGKMVMIARTGLQEKEFENNPMFIKWVTPWTEAI